MEKSSLKKELSLVNLFIMGTVGAIGTGVLFASTGMAAHAGPAIVISWILGGVFYFFVGLTYVQLAINYPEAGGPSRYSLYSHGRITNIINAFADFVWYLFISPIEALAVVEGINYFSAPHHFILIGSTGVPTTIGAILAVIIMLIFVPFNYYSIKFFGRSTMGLGIIKLAFYLAVMFGFIIFFFHYKNFTSYGGFAPFGFAGIFSAVPLAMFAFGGIRVIPDYAEEAKDPRDLGKAIVYTVLAQTLIYIGFAIAFVSSIDWKGLGLSIGNWASLSSLPGNPFIDIAGTRNFIPLLVLTGIVGLIGPFVTGYIYLGAGTRVLFAMGRSGYVSNKIKTLSKHHIPLWALIVVVAIGSIIAYLSAPLPTIYGLIVDAVVAGYIGFITNPVAMEALIAKGKIKPIVPGYKIIAPLAIIFAFLIVYWSGWPCVPYSVILLAILSIVFSAIYRVKENFRNSLWYIGGIAFLTLMSYIGSVGALNIVSFYEGSAITVIGALVFYYIGLKSAID
ncbi:MAG: APC family permease [Caldisphaeraceae archaeon]|nr:APC family permease [Caldisphaeraceae archaeon]